LLFTETFDAEEFIVLELKIEKLPIFFISKIEDFVSTASLAIRGLMWEVLVS
jgi:hypothetical protein